MSTATAFPDSATTPPDCPEHRPAPEPASWRETVLGLLAQGASVAAAMRHVGYSSAAFYKACNRHPEFRVEAGRARNAYRTQVAEEFHDAEAFARVLVDSVMRDEALPASLRLRAALAILNRKGDRWLPSPIPDDGVDTVDTMDTTNIMGLTDIVDTMDTVDSMDTVDTMDSVDTMDTVDTVDNPADFAYRQMLSQIEAMDSAFHPALQDTHPAQPAAEASSPMDTVDIAESMDTVDTTGIPIPQPRPGLTTSASGHSPNSAPGAPSIFSADRSRVTLPPSNYRPAGY